MIPEDRKVLMVKLQFPGWYKKYLRSPMWQARRNQILSQRKTCEVCGDNEKLEVHHLSYEHLFEEDDEELLLVCDVCHETIHRLQELSRFEKAKDQSCPGSTLFSTIYEVNFGTCREQFFQALDQYLTNCVGRRNLRNP